MCLAWGNKLVLGLGVVIFGERLELELGIIFGNKLVLGRGLSPLIP